MIIRVLQATIAPRRSADFHTFVVEQGLPRFREHDGLVDVYVGLRSEGSEDFGIIVSIWRDWDALAAAVGPDPLRPYPLPRRPASSRASRSCTSRRWIRCPAPNSSPA